jgi:hypothetical protein
MENNKIGSDIEPSEKVCYNCEHLAWLIGVGQGLKCINPKKEKTISNIPNSRHTCELFEFNSKLKNEIQDEKTS